ncbi:alcohol dehydrogenase catalytic domain-containing protein [Polycladomyces sp. WAk]|uniref:Alcohol dehydrogenase catalytic domain-containing protein n=1 Tax=Polycladomyces zharkentensis TaxID=2807616 RepID=A0ABS2WMZ6_9BACL|nr:alcohol dehydrogenase catalytic domain-containing protein [Polycladomyces sp. WAk]
MKAVSFNGMSDSKRFTTAIQESTEAIVRITAAAICGSDLHFYLGTTSGVRKCSQKP